MKTVHEVSKLTGVSIRTLQYYDNIGLLRPAQYTEAGYRLYDDAALETLQQILLFRELEFPLKEIREIIQSPGFDREKAIAQQIELLRLKKEHLENLISLARGIQDKGGKAKMDFKAFDRTKLEEYARKAKAEWGKTPEYREYEQKAAGRTEEETADINRRMLDIFAEIGKEKDTDPASEKVQALIGKLQAFITEHFYTCSDQVLFGLGQMYAAGGELAGSIDRVGGKGTGAFTNEAIRIHCAKKN